MQNPYLDRLINLNFQGVNRLFILSSENNDDRTARTGYFLPKLEIKDYNVMIDGQNVFDQPVRNDMRRYKNIQKDVTCQGDNYTTVCLLDYPYFKEHCKLTVID